MEIKHISSENLQKCISKKPFLSEVSHTFKIQNLDSQDWSDIFVEEPIFLCQAEQVLIFLGI